MLSLLNFRILLFAVLCGAVFFRVVELNLPFLESYNSIGRQSIVAAVAHNFYQYGFNFFYPQINENGHGPVPQHH